MFISNLRDVKELLQNNVELFRLHDRMSANASLKLVEDVSRFANFNHRRAVWFTEINSLYSSVVIVREFMKNLGDKPEELDHAFSLTSWFIDSCKEFDVNQNVFPGTIGLNTVLRRMRNSIGHGKFEIEKPAGESASGWLIVFKDEDVNPKNRLNADRFFELKIKVLNVAKFLEKLETSFKLKYP